MNLFEGRTRYALPVGAVAAVALVAGLQSSPDSGGGTARAAETNRPTYSVLARAANRRDDEFTRSSTALKHVAANPRLGVDARGTRVVRADESEILAVAPADAAPCLVSQRRSGGSHASCGTGNRPATAMVTYGAAVGVVPDSVSTVSFKLTDGTVVSGEVTENLWDAPAEAASVSFVVDGHTIAVQLMPRSALPDRAKVAADGTVSIGAPHGR